MLRNTCCLEDLLALEPPVSPFSSLGRGGHRMVQSKAQLQNDVLRSSPDQGGRALLSNPSSNGCHTHGRTGQTSRSERNEETSTSLPGSVSIATVCIPGPTNSRARPSLRFREVRMSHLDHSVLSSANRYDNSLWCTQIVLFVLQVPCDCN